MNTSVPDGAIHRCINPACARAMPRLVNFCPWCGTAQTAAARTRADERGAQAGRDAQRTAAAVAGASAAASLSGWSDAPEGMAAGTPAAAPVPPAAPPPPSPPPPSRPSPPAGAPAAPSAPPAASPPPPSAHAFGRSGTASPGAPPGRGGPASPPHQGVTAGNSRPPQREPIRLRWWIAALAVLWCVWLVAKPSAQKNERRIEAAIALARECKAREAQDELIALRSARATPAQLERLQKALNAEAAQCTRREQKEKAWLEVEGAAEAALKAGNVERARSRLQAFVRRWGEDEDTRALRARIDAARRDHPLAAPGER